MSAPVVVLGATGSIGTQTLQVAESLGLEVAGLAARRPSQELAAIATRYPDASIAVSGGSSEERQEFLAAVGADVAFDTDSVVAMASTPGVIVVNGIVGAAGLRATVAALESGNTVALANKESLVAGGPVVKALNESGGTLIPVDSEHSALLQCLVGEEPETVSRLILTASGGPFRGWDRESLAAVTPDQALSHPTWEMGARITVDSATLFNKGLEIIEAHFLFEAAYDQIDVVVHPQSILHGAVEFVDGSWKGHLGWPDMKVPIQYALTFPGRESADVKRFSLTEAEMTFEPPDRENFPALDIAYAAGHEGGSSPAVLNAADEVAVEAFLAGRLGFLGIPEVVSGTLEIVDWRPIGTVDDVIDVDREARATASGLITGAC